MGSLIRKAALVAMIMFYIPLLVLLGVLGNWAFFVVFLIIGLTVGIGEIVNNYWGYGKTLSTEFKHTLQRGGYRRILGFTALGCLGLAILCLIIHLGVYW